LLQRAEDILSLDAGLQGVLLPLGCDTGFPLALFFGLAGSFLPERRGLKCGLLSDIRHLLLGLSTRGSFAHG
jgi:hypothetical protein